MKELQNKIIKWANDRNIIKGSRPHDQVGKTLEETVELYQAILADDKDEIVDAIGDISVTLIIIAEQYGLDFEKCIRSAYNEIKDRKGKMINGVFVKEADL